MIDAWFVNDFHQMMSINLSMAIQILPVSVIIASDGNSYQNGELYSLFTNFLSGNLKLYIHSISMLFRDLRKWFLNIFPSSFACGFYFY